MPTVKTAHGIAYINYCLVDDCKLGETSTANEGQSFCLYNNNKASAVPYWQTLPDPLQNTFTMSITEGEQHVTRLHGGVIADSYRENGVCSFSFTEIQVEGSHAIPNPFELEGTRTSANRYNFIVFFVDKDTPYDKATYARAVFYSCCTVRRTVSYDRSNGGERYEYTVTATSPYRYGNDSIGYRYPTLNAPRVYGYVTFKQSLQNSGGTNPTRFTTDDYLLPIIPYKAAYFWPDPDQGALDPTELVNSSLNKQNICTDYDTASGLFTLKAIPLLFAVVELSIHNGTTSDTTVCQTFVNVYE